MDDGTGAKKVLPHYFAILQKKSLPYFKLLRKIPCKKQKTIRAMWNEHERAMRRFDGMKTLSRAEALSLADADHSLLDLKISIARKLLESCIFCERRCKVNRIKGEKGWCRVGAESRVSNMFEHLGEERFLVPSGTIFFSGCNWACVYCQNWDISQFPERGTVMSGEQIAGWLDFRAQTGRIINANFVGGEPTPNLHTILETMQYLESDIPMIWNSNMYMSEETVKLLDGAMDAHLADFRYGSNECAMKLSNAPKYMETITRNFKLIENRADLIVRILVIPSHVDCDAIPIINWLSENMPETVYVNLMSQYFPHWKANKMEGLNRRLGSSEFRKAADHLRKSKIKYYEIQ